MARITYASLFLNFIPDATDKPKTTEIDSLIQNYYEQASEIFYGVGFYPDDDIDTDTSDPKTLMRSKEFEGKIVAEISKKVQQWHDSGISSDGTVIHMPDFTISKKLHTKLSAMTGKKHRRITSVRMWGSPWDDAGVI